MPMTVIVANNVADRYRGFLTSVMPEVATGVYAAPEFSKGVRERVWAVLADWWTEVPGGSLLMLWKDNEAPGRMGVLSLGVPSRELADIDGLLVTKRR
jgi:CRISPR-associated protein Cas2